MRYLVNDVSRHRSLGFAGPPCCEPRAASTPYAFGKRARPQRALKTGAVALLILVVQSWVAGCLHLEQRVELADDGSAIVRLSYSLPEASFETVESAREQVDDWQGRKQGDIPYWPWNEAAVRRAIEAGGGEMMTYQTAIRDDRRQVTVAYRIERVNLEQGHELLPPFSVSDTERRGNRTITLDVTDVDTQAAAASADYEELKRLCKGLKLRFAVQVPGRITATTGTLLGDRVALWEFDADTDPGFLKKTPLIQLTYRTSEATE